MAVIVDPLIVGVVEVQVPDPLSTKICPIVPAGTHPVPPPPEYCGMFRVFAIKVAGPDDPVVVRVIGA